jgi:glyoxylase-like metal-dependent hydrolase (beta-lactamase superfamily II)
MIESKITPVSRDLFLITLPPPLPGFEDFISVWVKTGNPSFMVDTGVSVTVGALCEALQRISLPAPDYILLTHIHLDHAGGIGHLAERYPDSLVVCHASAIPHLVDPSRLWEGSLKTLGDTARAYGAIKPTPEHRLLKAEDFKEEGIQAFITPGHAPHHVAFKHSEHLFAGEACGVHLERPFGAVYHRPATPPKFFLETSLSSLDLLMAEAPEKICFGHHGISDRAFDWLSAHGKQLLLWKSILEDLMPGEGEEGFFNLCLERLIQEDPFMRPFHGFDPPTQKREFDLIQNSIKGYLGYLKTTR